MLKIGIDPCFRKNGFGVCIIDKKDNTVRTIIFKSFLLFLDFVSVELIEQDCVFCVENSNLQNSTFKKLYGSKGERNSRDVGKNQAVSQLTVDFLIMKFGIERVLQISPLQKGTVWSATICKQVAREYKLTLLNDFDKKKDDDRSAFMCAIRVVNKIIF